jgi:GNAT superfamily N-acetyltransferase
MSTIPAARRRGVQAALVRHRLARAATLGCELAAATAAVGSASERNLVRLGFEAQFAVETWTRHGGRGRAQPGSFTGARRTGSPTSAS